MRAGYRVTLGVLTIMILLTITVGTSYSYYAFSDSQEGENNLTTSCFEVAFTGEGDSINLTKAYPMSEATAVGDGQTGAVKPYTFTLTNNCSKDTNYVVTFSPLSGKDTLLQYTNYKLSEGVGKVDSNFKKINLAQPFNNLPDSYKTGITGTYNLANGVLQYGEANKKTFYLYLWIDENACNNTDSCEQIMGQSLEGKIIVYTYM